VFNALSLIQTRMYIVWGQNTCRRCNTKFNRGKQDVMPIKGQRPVHLDKVPIALDGEVGGRDGVCRWRDLAQLHPLPHHFNQLSCGTCRVAQLPLQGFQPHPLAEELVRPG
jgi:hypothetical protein